MEARMARFWFDPERLVALAADRGWNDTQIAAASGLSLASVWFYMRGERTPNARSLAALATAFQTTPDAFFSRMDTEVPA
jgi:transcriptional regulator with XRE-family HTH domain